MEQEAPAPDLVEGAERPRHPDQDDGDAGEEGEPAGGGPPVARAEGDQAQEQSGETADPDAGGREVDPLLADVEPDPRAPGGGVALEDVGQHRRQRRHSDQDDRAAPGRRKNKEGEADARQRHGPDQEGVADRAGQEAADRQVGARPLGLGETEQPRHGEGPRQDHRRTEPPGRLPPQHDELVEGQPEQPDQPREVEPAGHHGHLRGPRGLDRGPLGGARRRLPDTEAERPRGQVAVDGRDRLPGHRVHALRKGRGNRDPQDGGALPRDLLGAAPRQLPARGVEHLDQRLPEVRLLGERDHDLRRGARQGGARRRVRVAPQGMGGRAGAHQQGEPQRGEDRREKEAPGTAPGPDEHARRSSSARPRSRSGPGPPRR